MAYGLEEKVIPDTTSAEEFNLLHAPVEDLDVSQPPAAHVEAQVHAEAMDVRLAHIALAREPTVGLLLRPHGPAVGAKDHAVRMGAKQMTPRAHVLVPPRSALHILRFHVAARPHV